MLPLLRGPKRLRARHARPGPGPWRIAASLALCVYAASLSVPCPGPGFDAGSSRVAEQAPPRGAGEHAGHAAGHPVHAASDAEVAAAPTAFLAPRPPCQCQALPQAAGVSTAPGQVLLRVAVVFDVERPAHPVVSPIARPPQAPRAAIEHVPISFLA
jgi:hypothetical protein